MEYKPRLTMREGVFLYDGRPLPDEKKKQAADIAAFNREVGNASKREARRAYRKATKAVRKTEVRLEKKEGYAKDY